MELRDGSARSAVRSNGKWPKVQFPIDIFFRERHQPIIQIRRREISRRRKGRKGERKKDRDPKVDRGKNLFSTRTTTFGDVCAISAHAAYIFHTRYARFPFVDKKITVRLHLRHLAQYRPPRQSQLAGRIERGISADLGPYRMHINADIKQERLLNGPRYAYHVVLCFYKTDNWKSAIEFIIARALRGKQYRATNCYIARASERATLARAFSEFVRVSYQHVQLIIVVT